MNTVQVYATSSQFSIESTRVTKDSARFADDSIQLYLIFTQVNRSFKQYES